MPRADEDDRHRDAHADDVEAGLPDELGAVRLLSADGEEQQRDDCEVDGVDEREGASALAAGLGREDRQEDQDPHLGEGDEAGPAVVAAVDLDVERPVDPGDPDQREDDGEVDCPAHGEVLREVVRCLAITATYTRS